MPAIVIPPGFAHVDHSLFLADYSRPAHITYGVEVQEFIPAEEIALELAGVASAVHGVMQMVDAQVTLRRTVVTVGTDGPPLIGEAATNLAGAVGGSSVTPALAVFIRKATAVGGRRNKGANFIPWGCPEGEVAENGTIAPSRLATIQGIVTGWLDDLSTAGYPMVILHRVGLSEVPDPTPVTNLLVSPTISNQVRRQVRFV